MVVKGVSDERLCESYQSCEDRELLKKSVKGDKRAFDEFYKRYFHNLVRFLMAYCGNRSLAEDVVQDVFLKLMGLKFNLGFVKNVKAYIYTTALNRCRDVVRRESKNLDFEDVNQGITAIGDKKDENVDIGIVNNLIQRLPEMQKEVLLLRTRSDLTFKEIGDILHISENSAKVNYFYAVTSLKKMISGGQDE